MELKSSVATSCHNLAKNEENKATRSQAISPRTDARLCARVPSPRPTDLLQSLLSKDSGINRHHSKHSLPLTRGFIKVYHAHVPKINIQQLTKLFIKIFRNYFENLQSHRYSCSSPVQYLLSVRTFHFLHSRMVMFRFEGIKDQLFFVTLFISFQFQLYSSRTIRLL